MTVKRGLVESNDYLLSRAAFKEFAMIKPSAEIAYQIDCNDRLVGFNDQWNVFAANNDGFLLSSQFACNVSIWDFIHDAETRHIHKVLLKKVRKSHQALSFPFRCDSPDVRRYMRMGISPQGDGNVMYRCSFIREEAREPLASEAPPFEDRNTFLRMCSWCKKADVGGNVWMEIEDAVEHLGLFSSAQLQPITHTMCEACLALLSE